MPFLQFSKQQQITSVINNIKIEAEISKSSYF